MMIYNKPEAPPVIRQLQRWVNNKRIFYTVNNFADYKTSLRKEEKIGVCKRACGFGQGAE